MKNQSLSAWHLYWALIAAYAVAWAISLGFVDPWSSNGAEFLVKQAVRCALPYFLLAFTASSFVALWPNRFTKWLRANRRFFGVAFATAMGWHLTVVAFAFWRFNSRLSLRDFLQDAAGLAFLLLLTLTSFRAVARHLRPITWRRLHKVGVYVIWGVATHIYLGRLRTHGGLVDALFFSGLIAAWLVRITAWIASHRGSQGNRVIHGHRRSLELDRVGTGGPTRSSDERSSRTGGFT
jgi:methionine sulfoxide reductase heme-binding subunit